MAASVTATREPAGRAGWRAVALPSEHGGWGLTAEPVVLGLIISPSVAGLVLGIGAMCAFLARTPAKLVLVDRWRGRSLARTRLAAQVAAVELAVIAACLVTAVLTADGRFWIPLVAALPLLLLELYYDMRSRGRRLVPELAGSIGISAVAAAIVLAGGGEVQWAVGAWLVLTARAIAALPFVRHQIQRNKGHEEGRLPVDLSELVAVALAVLGVLLGWLPVAAAVVLGLIVVVQLVMSFTPPRPAVAIGVGQTIAGLALVIVAGVAMT